MNTSQQDHNKEKDQINKTAGQPTNPMPSKESKEGQKECTTQKEHSPMNTASRDREHQKI